MNWLVALSLVFCLASGAYATNFPGDRSEAANLNPLDLGTRFFQQAISPVDGPRCHMYPTCSAYARQAARKHGFLLGVMLTVDRLLHEVEPSFQQRPVWVGGRWRFADPLSNNTLWWRKSDSTGGEERHQAGSTSRKMEETP